MSAPLAELDVLIIDCQATQAYPAGGNLLEIGWAHTRALKRCTGNTPPLTIETALIACPTENLSRKVSRLTGISPDDLAGAHEPGDIWKRLTGAAQKCAVEDRSGICTAVIHFARFEEPYLRKLHTLYGGDRPFPFRIICTHEIAKRMFPDLPRRGLRAVAGYFGWSVAELRRSSHHIAATAFIWRRMVELLEADYDVRTLDELLYWLDHTPGLSKTGRAYPMERADRLGLPDKPGVYRMLRSNGDVLYVGKASSLKKRVNSYFQKRNSHPEHILEMLTQAHSLDITVTRSSLEAALLESDEIKRLSPPYNVSLREHDRSLWFYSPDLINHSTDADERHTIGPVPCHEKLDTLAVIRDLADHTERHAEAFDGSIPSRALGIPVEYAPDGEIFQAGFYLFMARHAEFFSGRTGIGGVVRLGAHLERRHLAEVEISESPHEPPEGSDDMDEKLSTTPDEARTWTPESVAEGLERTVRHCALLIRRARWFCLLSESVLSWRPPQSDRGLIHILRIRNGAIVHRGNLAEGEKTPAPDGPTDCALRRRHFDVATYDRMRVLTTELRRLVAQGRDIELSLSASRTLKQHHLERILGWV